MTAATKQLEHNRVIIASSRERRHELGQFLTPNPVSDFMASLFESQWQEWNLLDAGAGSGALSAAWVKWLCSSRHRPKSISITACELDGALIEPLRVTLHQCEQVCDGAGVRFSAKVLNEDFITFAVPIVRGD